MSRWSLEFGSDAIRSLDRLPEKIAAAVVEFVTGTLPQDPVRMSKPLQAELAEWRVARRGDYRVFLRLDLDHHVILIGRIEHRATVYRRR